MRSVTMAVRPPGSGDFRRPVIVVSPTSTSASRPSASARSKRAYGTASTPRVPDHKGCVHTSSAPAASQYSRCQSVLR